MILQTSQIELSKSALENNLNFIRQKIDPVTSISAVVKGNAYGHGIEEFVPLAESLGIDHFSVFSAHEAYRVLQVKSKETRILIMGEVEEEQIIWAINNEIEFFVFDRDRLINAGEYAKVLGKKAIIHIEVETGMNRTGFEYEKLKNVVELLKYYEHNLYFKGICTHFAGAESVANYLRVKNQIREFQRVYEYFCEAGICPEVRHAACSAAALNYPSTHMDLVRIGILLYGFWPNKETFIYQMREQKLKDPLKRVITWKTKVMNVKKVRIGEFVGYGTSFQAEDEMEIAIVPVGYAYGFGRSLSNSGYVLIGGKKAPVVGMVNMNLMQVDVSEIPNVKKGDEVVIIGHQKNEEASVAAFGELSNQPNYELLTRLPSDLPRKVVE
jgi:alanine racemase